MKRSALFYSDRYLAVQRAIMSFLNGHEEFMSSGTIESPRAVGDAIQRVLAENFECILGADVCAKYSSAFARRAMADLAFEDHDGFYYVVDVKTHRLSTKFNMPNLTSVERLARFYEDDRNYFVMLMLAYDIAGLKVDVRDAWFLPVEFLDWGCLTIGALGWGQIQIANSSDIRISPGYSRRKWMIELCDTLLEFYPKEIEKIHARLEWFRDVKARWLARPD